MITPTTTAVSAADAAAQIAAVRRLHAAVPRFQHDVEGDSFDTITDAAEAGNIRRDQVTYFLVCSSCAAIEQLDDPNVCTCDQPRLYRDSLWPCATITAIDGTDTTLGECPTCRVPMTGHGHVQVGADIIAIRRGDVLLIERGRDPHAGRLALPGGRLDEADIDDTVDEVTIAAAAAVREAREETGLHLNAEQLIYVGCYTTPGRDPRGPAVSHAFAVILPDDAVAVAGDDAAAATWTPLGEAVELDLAFDHGRILRDAMTAMEAWV